MKKKLFVLVIVYISLYVNTYAADNKLKIATLATDKTLATNKTLREEYLSALKNYTYIKHKSLFSSDFKKVFTFRKNKITTNQAMQVSSNIKADFVFIFDVVTTIVDNTNTEATNVIDDYTVDITPIDTNESSTNISDTPSIEETNIINENITNISPILAEESIITNEVMTNQITLTTNTICTIYVFKPSSGEIIRTEVYDNLASTREKVDAITKSFETYLANLILDSIPKPDNDINLNFFIVKETADGSSTILEEGEKLYNGDVLTLNFDVNKTGYLYIMLIEASGSVILIQPNDFNTNFTTKQIPIEADKYYSIPNEEDIFKINIVESKGIDRLFIIYSSRAQTWFDKDFSGVGFKISNPNTLVAKMSSIKSSLSLIGKNNYKILTFNLEYNVPPPEEKDIPEINKNDEKTNETENKENTIIEDIEKEDKENLEEMQKQNETDNTINSTLPKEVI